MVADYILKFIDDRRSYCSSRTVMYYVENLEKFNKWLKQQDIDEIEQLDDDVLREYVLQLRQANIKNTSVGTYYRAVKVFMKWLHDHNYVSDDYTKCVKLPRNDAELIIPLTQAEVSLCDSYFLDLKENALRNYCMFHLMLDCGLRRSEVINLVPGNIAGNNMLHICNSKYNKSRIVLLPEFLEKSIQNYVCADGRPYVFLDRWILSPVTVSTFGKMFYSLRKETGIKRLHPHLLRHTFATSYLYHGGNMEMLRLLMGHSDYNITRTYLHLATQEQLIQSDIYKIDDIFFRR